MLHGALSHLKFALILCLLLTNLWSLFQLHAPRRGWYTLIATPCWFLFTNNEIACLPNMQASLKKVDISTTPRDFLCLLFVARYACRNLPRQFWPLYYFNFRLWQYIMCEWERHNQIYFDYSPPGATGGEYWNRSCVSVYHAWFLWNGL